jgi:hypothetical protein
MQMRCQAEHPILGQPQGEHLIASAYQIDAKILLSSRDDIAADCLAIIGEISDTDSRTLAGLAAEAGIGHEPG